MGIPLVRNFFLGARDAVWNSNPDREHRTYMPGNPVPFFSVIIPTRLRHDRLAACLRSLVKSDYPRERMEVIVVDQASGSPPRGVLAAFSEQLNLAMIELGSGGAARARNAGAKHARGDYVAFINEDCACTSDWLRALSAGFALDANAAITGRTVNALPNRLTSEASQAILDFRSLHSRQQNGNARILFASNLALPTSAYREIGGFDESDSMRNCAAQEFSDRWIKSNRHVVYLSEAVVLEAHTPSITSFLRAHFDLGSGACQIDRKRAHEEEARTEVSEPSVRELMHYPFERRAGWRAPFLSILIGVAQCVRSIGYRSAKLRVAR